MLTTRQPDFPFAPLSPPIDAGLTGLGLATRVFAGVGLCLSIAAAMVVPMAAGGSVDSNPLGWLWLIVAVIRGVFHMQVGDQALRRTPTVRRAAQLYLGAAIIHTILGLAAVFAQTNNLPPETFLFIAGAIILSLGWPVALSVLLHRRAVSDAFTAADTFDTPLTPADRGIGSIAVLLVSFAASTLPVVINLTTNILGERGPRAFVFYLLLGTLAAFLVRGVLAIRTGWRSLYRPTTMTEFRRSLGGYRIAAGIASVLLVVTFVVHDQLRNMLAQSPFIGTLMLGCLVAATWIWPQTVGRFSQQLDMEDATLGEADALPPSSDAGLVTLGQYMLYFSLVGVGTIVMVLGAGGLGLLEDVPGAETLFGFGNDLGTILSVATLGIHFALAVTLVRMRQLLQRIMPLLAAWVLLNLANLVVSLTELDASMALAGATLLGTLVGTLLSVAATVVLLLPAIRRLKHGRGPLA